MGRPRDLGDSASVINILDGATAGTIVNSKAVAYGSSGEVNATTLQLSGTAISATAAEINLLDGVTATTAELNYVDGVTSNIQTQLDNISVTGGTLTKTFLAGEQSTITLTSGVLVPNVTVTKEVAQTGTTNNDWLVNSSSENYTRYNSATAVTLTPSAVGDGTFTLGSGSFASADVGKRIEGNGGVAILTATNGSYTALTNFANTNAIASGSWAMYGLQFNTTDGDLELSGNVVNDFTTATKLDDFDIGQSEGAPRGLAFNPDGTVMLISGDSTNLILQYTLTTGFDLTTASYANKSYNAGGLDGSPRGVRFNNDGTKLLFIGESNRRVYGVPLTTAYDVSTSSSYQSFNISSSQTTDPTGLEFNPDGTIMYIVGRDNDECYQYTLTTGFDVTTASYANKKVDLSSGIGGLDPYGLFITADGTKLYHCGHAQFKVFEFEMSTPFDVSTASYTNRSKSINPDSTDLTGVYFTSDAIGKMYVLGQGNDYVVEYSVLTATYPTTGYHAAHTNLSTDSTYWTDINSMTASESAGSGNIYYCVSTDDRTTWKIAKGTDGERNIAKNSSGTWQYNSNATYGSETWTNATVNAELYAIQEAVAYSNTVTTTSGADDLASVSLTSSFSVSSQTSGPEAITFNSNGTRMIVGSTSDSSIKEYHLTTGFDVSTASYDSSNSLGLGRIDGVAFNSDGTKMYIVSYSNASIHQFTLSTGFDISTAGSAVGSYNTSSVQTNMRGVQINNNGTKIYTISDNDDQIEEFTMSTAYDVTTASHTSSTSIGTQSGNPQGFCFNGDGTILFVCDESDSSGTVYQYSLSTAYDTSTLSYASKSYATGNGIAGVFVTADGSKMFGAMNGDDTIKEYALESTTSTTTFPNQMNKTQLDAIPDANHFTLGNDLDLAIIMNQGSGATSLPSSDGVAINYDAAVLNQGAILGTDYNFDAPATNKVRITAVNAANLKVRVV